jgi:FtsH-binding integral membrane protein
MNTSVFLWFGLGLIAAGVVAVVLQYLSFCIYQRGRVLPLLVVRFVGGFVLLILF